MSKSTEIICNDDYMFSLRYYFHDENEMSCFHEMVTNNISKSVSKGEPNEFNSKYRVIIDNIELMSENEVLYLKELHEIFKISTMSFDFFLAVKSMKYEGGIDVPQDVVKLIRFLGGQVVFSYLVYDE